MIRSFLLLAALLLAALAPPVLAADEPGFPALTGRVVDDANVLPEGLAARLTRELAAHEQRTGQQVVVAVVKSLNGREIEDYGYRLGRAWGIGQKGTNTGAILLVAPAERKVRIEVGYGLEGELTDAASATIIDQAILPRFRAGDITGGIVAGTEQMLRLLGDDVAAPESPRIQPTPQDGGHGSIGSILLIFAIFAVFMFFAGRRGGGSAILPFLLFSSLGGRGGGGSFGSDSGGGFSGGGGSFGGGGASGSW